MSSTSFASKRLDEISADNRFAIVDGPFGTQLHASEYIDEGVPVVRVVNTSFEGRFLSEKLVFISERKAKQLKRSRVVPGDIIVAKTGATIGKSGVFPSNWDDGIIASSCIKMTVDPSKVDNRFVGYLIQSSDGQRKIIDGSGGSTRTTINTKPFGAIEFRFPSRSEQTKIAEILSTVDQAIEQTEALIAKQQRIKTALMQDLLTCGIDEDGNLRSEETHEFKDSQLGRIPVEWEVKHLRDFALVKGGKRLPGGHSYVEEDTGFRYLRVLDFYKRVIDYSSLKNIVYSTFKTLARYEIRPGNIAVSIAGSLGYFALVSPSDGIRTILTENAARIVSDNIVDPYFLSTMLNSQIVQRQIEGEKGTGGGVPKLALFRIKTLCVPCPSDLDEQRRIYECLESNEAAFLKSLESLHKLCSLKTALMQDLLTGNVSVTRLLTEVDIRE